MSARVIHPHDPVLYCHCREPDCVCDNSYADVITSKGLPVCACCFVNCPDVHPELT